MKLVSRLVCLSKKLTYHSYDNPLIFQEAFDDLPQLYERYNIFFLETATSSRFYL